MTEMDRLYRWNQWFDRQPEASRSQLVFWSLIAIAAVNTALSIWTGFPLLLLVVLAIAGLALVRMPYKLGWLQAPPPGSAEPARMQIEASPFVHAANQWYDAQPEGKRAATVLGILVAAGALNMLLTFSSDFPFGLLFLLAFLALIAIRVPYTNGWLKPPANAQPMLPAGAAPSAALPPHNAGMARNAGDPG